MFDPVVRHADGRSLITSTSTSTSTRTRTGAENDEEMELRTMIAFGD
ncbi:hypothetical protein [Streptomyces sundarbansensis]